MGTNCSPQLKLMESRDILSLGTVSTTELGMHNRSLGHEIYFWYAHMEACNKLFKFKLNFGFQKKFRFQNSKFPISNIFFVPQFFLRFEIHYLNLK